MNAQDKANLATLTEAAEQLGCNRATLKSAVNVGLVRVAGWKPTNRGGPPRMLVALDDVREWMKPRPLVYTHKSDPRKIACERQIDYMSAVRGVQRARRKRLMELLGAE